MNGVRVFAAYLGLVWFFLGFANLLTVLDRFKEKLEQDDSVAEAYELRLERAEKALDVVEKEWEAKLAIVDKKIEQYEKEIDEAEEAEDIVTKQLAEVELAREQSMRVGQEELRVRAIESAENRIEELEASQIQLMDWIRSVGGTAVGLLLIAFAWRGPPLKWEDVLADTDADGSGAVEPTAVSTSSAAASQPEVEDDLILDIDDPSEPS